MSSELHGYVVEHCSPRDEALLAIERETDALGSEAIMQMAPEQGALFTVLVGAMGARLAVEVGTFTGYGATCIARGLADGGRLICFGVDEHSRQIARRNPGGAGVGDRVTAEVGRAADGLARLLGEPQGDFAYAAAQKPALP